VAFARPGERGRVQLTLTAPLPASADTAVGTVAARARRPHRREGHVGRYGEPVALGLELAL